MPRDLSDLRPARFDPAELNVTLTRINGLHPLRETFARGLSRVKEEEEERSFSTFAYARCMLAVIAAV